ncbi:GH92 family glycosyl hydrolase [Parapedobacter composti]|nr:GH92 family glycosyl hydrolase [Parapedobacter composti]
MRPRLTCLGLWTLSLLAASCGTAQKKQLSDYVDPNIGTAHSRWFFYTPAAVPFGMAKVGPSTNGHYGNEHGWEAVGYDFRHESIEGFANFHEFQVGGVVLAPLVGTLKTTPGKLENPDEGYRSRFDKADEYATSGFYSVLLKDYGVRAELTATPRVGYHRYVFPKSDDAHILFDIGNRQGESGAVKTAQVTLTDDGRVEGYVITTPEYVKKYQAGAEVAMYFAAVLDKAPAAWGAFNGDSVRSGAKQATGRGAGLYLTFNTEEDEAVTVKVGLSYTSIANARLNLASEAEELDFDAAKQQALDTWNDYLGRITVEGTNEDDKRKFYTGLFHALLGRGLASDVNGAYPKNDGSVGQIPLDASGKPEHHHYNTDAIWGGFWNLTQLWAMAYPAYYADWIQSQLLVYQDAGWLGDGIANSKYVSGVGTNFTGLAIAAAYQAGIRGFDVETAYAAARKNELSWEGRLEGAGKMDVRQFVQRGYAPYVEQLGFDTSDEGSGFGASHTLEYAFSAHAVAQFAKALGKEADYLQLTALAQGWRHLFDEETGFIRPRDASGQFIADFDPSQPWRGFQEGNAWQYTFYVPHDPAGLIEALGEDVFNNRLDSIFEVSRANIFGGGKTIDAFAGLSGLYNHGNQPNLHISWLFNFSGKPWLTQKWTRAISSEFYGVEPIHGYGFGQDEDQGQLGAWYVMAALGLFDVKGLTDAEPTLQFGSPVFDRATIKLASGKTLVIETKGNSADNLYVQALQFNGRPYDKNWIYWRDLMEGGTLTFDMGDSPNTTWGTSERPPSAYADRSPLKEPR